MIFYNQKWLSWFFRSYFWGLAAWPFIFFREPESEVAPWQLVHETEHLRQQCRGLIIGYLLKYYYELFYNRYHDKMTWEDSYLNISYEIKAREAELL